MTEASVRIAAWNVNSLKVRLPQVLRWLQEQEKANKPIDALCLQELKLTDDKYPHQALEEAGYYSLAAGQKTYNGVAIILRKASLASMSSDLETAFLKPVRNIPGFSDEQQRILAATVCFKGMSPIRIISAYFPNGQSPDSDKFAYKLDWLEQLQSWLEAELITYPRLALLGDFNIAPTDADVHDPKAWEGQNLVSPQERAAFVGLTKLGLCDSFRLFDQPPKTYSWWDYRMMGFRRNAGMRIDHILLSDVLKDKCIQSTVDKEPRTWEQPSDHAPVIAQITA
ncbi:exodeoxyribonuclease III [Polynucleobacter sphagniphilus]|jgi:exodeoxyribonuclease-3|uniref:Exodeoxyribonuclease-3 n=1 Tax=Polynucleobacter sphagniphilus TaxID=1743169 RepID=A0AA43S5L7_9BURK|nr:exodeoxyribonuclease III [Polynucleobacter sphagniphilus]MDH6155646.1 exodeoxyribonuclease-3 [Polynucleobacter sphagniphilus]MDH6241054.1 exodeoxyribonuclease-3 [Polynucleobacter sphagniphilus]MDH6299396.1 exodeoxyribonuclease-3 [Polynucleobacter sphagniphilus]MDH6420162.1 exodeoxyribonuclease-3 [Polynucleobacter sphagniphilus]MDH6503502.1 exodeoxyribonuclease-3 [Polynucleobacter sphagniphilus]